MRQGEAVLEASLPPSDDAGAVTPRATASQAVMVAILSFIIMVIDGYDIGAMPIVVPHLAPLWGVEHAAFGAALSAVVMGLGVGAFLFAPLGDWLGRRTTTVGALLIVSFATMATGWSQTVEELFWWRLLTGTALGTCLPNVLAILAQVVSPKRRARAITIVGCGIPVGAAGAGLIVPNIMAARGWEATFILPAMCMFAITAFIALYLYRVPMPDGPQQAVGQKKWHWTDIPILAPLGRKYLLRTAIFSGLFCFNALSMFMLSSWLPTVVQQSGFSLENAALMASLVQIGGLVGGLILATQIDRHRTIGALLVGYALVSLSLLALTILAPQVVSWGILMLLIGMGVGGAHIALTAVAANIYPIAMLSAAIGLAITVARLGAMAGPMVGAALVAGGFPASVFFLALLVPVGLCILCVLAFAWARLASGPADAAPLKPEE
jgi:AAHS family 4-hydroxybenzoate transporter-like MFS transporter